MTWSSVRGEKREARTQNSMAARLRAFLRHPFLIFSTLSIRIFGSVRVGDIEVDVRPPGPRGAPPNSPRSVH